MIFWKITTSSSNLLAAPTRIFSPFLNAMFELVNREEQSPCFLWQPFLVNLKKFIQEKNHEIIERLDSENFLGIANIPKSTPFSKFTNLALKT